MTTVPTVPTVLTVLFVASITVMSMIATSAGVQRLWPFVLPPRWPALQLGRAPLLLGRIGEPVLSFE
jgi:hypothetical protein